MAPSLRPSIHASPMFGMLSYRPPPSPALRPRCRAWRGGGGLARRRRRGRQLESAARELNVADRGEPPEEAPTSEVGVPPPPSCGVAGRPPPWTPGDAAPPPTEFSPHNEASH
eukprot:gene14072-biopygen14150